MATELETLVVKIAGDTADINQKMTEAASHVKAHTESMSAAIASFADESNKHFLDFHHVAETALGVFGGELLMKGLEMAGEAIAHFFEMISEGIAIASANELAVTRLGTALGTAGKYSEEASKQIQEFAEALSHSSNYSQDQILQGTALIETLGKLDEDGLKRATQAAVTMSAALGIDLQTASMLVGRAAEGNIATFTRYGLAVEKGANDSQTFANALSAIEGLGDAAANQANTYAGSVKGLGNEYEELLKAIGQTITQNEAVKFAIQAAGQAVQQATAYINEHKQGIKLMVAEGLVLAISVTQVFIDTLNVVWKTGLKAFEDIMVPVKLLVAALVAASDVIQGKFSQAWDGFKTNAKSAFQDVADASGKNGLDAVSKGLDTMGIAAARGFMNIQSGAAGSVQQFNNLHPHIKQAAAEVTLMAQEGKKLAEGLLKNDPAKIYKDQEKSLKLSLDQQQISLSDYHAKQLAALNEEYAQEQGMLEQALAEKQITQQQYQDAVATMQEKSALEHRELGQKQKTEDEKLLDQKVQATSQTFGNLSSLMKTKNAEMFEIGKAAAVAQAIVDGYAAFAKALSAAPPPFNYALAASVGVASAVNIANIESTHLATGIDSVPGIGGFDNFPAVLAPGERVVPAQTNQDLTAFLQGGGGNGQQASLLAAIGQKLDRLGDLMASGMSVSIDGQRFMAILRNQTRGGRTFA